MNFYCVFFYCMVFIWHAQLLLLMPIMAFVSVVMAQQLRVLLNMNHQRATARSHCQECIGHWLCIWWLLIHASPHYSIFYVFNKGTAYWQHRCFIPGKCLWGSIKNMKVISPTHLHTIELSYTLSIKKKSYDDMVALLLCHHTVGWIMRNLMLMVLIPLNNAFEFDEKNIWKTEMQFSCQMLGSLLIIIIKQQ